MRWSRVSSSSARRGEINHHQNAKSTKAFWALANVFVFFVSLVVL
jgi:hypothetical protein